MKRTTGRRWMEIREEVRRRNPYCVHCQRNNVIRLWDEVDHIIRVDDGGTDDYSNLQGLCFEHHYKKTQREQGNTYKSKINKSGIPSDPDHHWNR
jgi:5-methylcytosine-specific restriction protein A